jgi:hypothetical protein
VPTPTEPRFTTPARRIRRRERHEPAVNFLLSIRLIERGVIDVSQIITHQMPRTRTDELKSLNGTDSGAIKAVILFE